MSRNKTIPHGPVRYLSQKPVVCQGESSRGPAGFKWTTAQSPKADLAITPLRGFRARFTDDRRRHLGNLTAGPAEERVQGSTVSGRAFVGISDKDRVPGTKGYAHFSAMALSKQVPRDNGFLLDELIVGAGEHTASAGPGKTIFPVLKAFRIQFSDGRDGKLHDHEFRRLAIFHDKGRYVVDMSDKGPGVDFFDEYDWGARFNVPTAFAGSSRDLDARVTWYLLREQPNSKWRLQEHEVRFHSKGRSSSKRHPVKLGHRPTRAFAFLGGFVMERSGHGDADIQGIGVNIPTVEITDDGFVFEANYLADTSGGADVVLRVVTLHQEP